MKVKVGDKIIVIAGKNRGKVSTVTRIVAKSNQVVVEGVNIVKKHVKPSEGNKGGIVEFEKPIDASNVMLICPKTDKPTRIAYKGVGKDKKRVCKVSDFTLDN